MVCLLFLPNFQLKILGARPADLEDVAQVTLGLNKQWKGLLEATENQVVLVTKRFLYGTGDERLIDLHSIAFTLVYLAEQEMKHSSAHVNDIRFTRILSEVKLLHLVSKLGSVKFVVTAQPSNTCFRSGRRRLRPRLRLQQNSWSP
eukprot:Gregarina_sp_Poly_1__11079@NODE_891_length_5834_cov_21_977978_g635_i0_p3_GENE_NODE_891_length_5834_cov_21_977978_g635_i0NODE_891_length_5834_cov_21_977978_g635_i0_p3_ORF_typecomplete_len146_score11_34_NODE_891_length_5834_cov_21_977978_g635_i053895826